MKEYRNRIISTIFIVLTTAAVVFMCYKLSVKPVPTVSSAVEETTAEVTEASSEEPTTELSQVIEKTDDSLTVTYPKQQKTTVDTSEIVIKGVCDKDKPLKINSQDIETDANGNFSFTYTLMLGENTITITNGKASYDYVVVYKLKIISAVSPTGNIVKEGGEEISLVACALKDSNVYAVINGATVSLSPQKSESKDGFVNYSGVYKLPAASSVDTNLGKVVFYAEYADSKDSMQGAGVTVKAYKLSDIVIEKGEGTVIPPEIKGGDVVNVLSPKEDHGRGTALMCSVTSKYAETVPTSSHDEKSDPRYTPLANGTVDYVTGEGTYDGEQYYKLLSGVIVEKKKVTSFQGYIMPTNTVSVYKTYRADGYTNIILTMNWKVPFFADLKPQSYAKGYSGRLFNVSSFTADHIDITFKYTNAAQGSFDFSGSNAVSSASWTSIGTDGSTTLRINLANKGKFYGYKAYYSSDNRLVIQFKERPNKSKPVVVLDPGHGGKDCGAIAVNGTFEANVNLRIAALVKENLEKSGCKVIILRTSNVFISKDDRQQMARDMGGDIYVSVHCNSSESSSLSGTEVYYYRAFSKDLASSIHNQLASAWKGIYSDNADMRKRVVPNDGGVRFYPFRVIRVEECPAVLVECGYLSNKTEGELLCRDDVQRSVAKAISDGIVHYFENL